MEIGYNEQGSAILLLYNRVNLSIKMTNLADRYNRVFENKRVCYNQVSLYIKIFDMLLN